MKDPCSVTGEWRLIGTVAVDSGSLCIIDPCYVSDGFDYEKEVVAATFEKLAPRGLPYLPLLREGMGVQFGTYYGDGQYRVYGLFREDEARLAPLAVLVDTEGVFEDEEDEEDDDVYPADDDNYPEYEEYLDESGFTVSY